MGEEKLTWDVKLRVGGESRFEKKIEGKRIGSETEMQGEVQNGIIQEQDALIRWNRVWLEN